MRRYMQDFWGEKGRIGESRCIRDRKRHKEEREGKNGKEVTKCDRMYINVNGLI